MQESGENVESLQKERVGQIRNNEDLASKFAMQFFGAELLRYLGIRVKIRRIEPTEYVHLEVKQMYEDFNFQMEDGCWYHVEFESDSITTDDLRRFREYEAVTSRTHRVPVVTYVLCSSRVKNPKTSIKEGINTYRIKVIRLKNKNADMVFDSLKKKSCAEMTKEDLVPVVLTTLMDGEMPQVERVKQGIRILSKEYPGVTREDIKRMQAVLYLLADKFLTQDEMEEVKEECVMNAFLQLYVEDGIRQGRAEGIAESVLELLGGVGTTASDISNRIREEKNDETLKRWLKLAARAESVEQFVKEM